MRADPPPQGCRDGDAETVRAVQHGPIPDPRTVAPEIPPELARIVKTALERNREHRYPTAFHVARDLDAFTSGRTSAAEVKGQIAQLVGQLSRLITDIRGEGQAGPDEIAEPKPGLLQRADTLVTQLNKIQ